MLSARAALLATLLLTISPLHVYYSQEVRMYGLVALLSVGILAAAWRVFDTETQRHGDEPPYHLITLITLLTYILLTTAALYTQYYAIFLPVGLTIYATWCWRRDLRALLAWLGAQMIVALLYLPWVIYAAPKLAPYISQKIVADADRPLGAFAYLARHLAAFLVGHLEGPLARWWPAALLLLLPLLIGWVLTAKRRAGGGGVWAWGQWRSLGIEAMVPPSHTPTQPHAQTPIPLLATVDPHRAHPWLADLPARALFPGARRTPADSGAAAVSPAGRGRAGCPLDTLARRRSHRARIDRGDFSRQSGRVLHRSPLSRR